MALTTAVSLTGDDLTLQDVWAVAVEGGRAELAEQGRERLQAARELVERRAAESSGEHTYGINTGFGRFVSKTIPPELAEELQLRLLRSHACGVGSPYPPEVVRAAMLLRANTLAKGYSGARPETVDLLLECLNRGVTPVVPSRGSVGASGDLAPLAHLALPLVGEGKAVVEGETLPGAEALDRVGLEPVELRAKEGLSLINGTQFMAGIGALVLVRAQRLARTADIACALSLEALQGSRASFLPEIHALRPLAGQQASAANVVRLLEGSAILEAHRWCDKVQDAYSLRCVPQVHGASRDLLAYAETTVASRAQRGHRQPTRLRRAGRARLRTATSTGSRSPSRSTLLRWRSRSSRSISERRVERLSNPALSDGLPAFLTHDGGLNSGFMIPQYVAAALVSENKVLCHPAGDRLHPTSAGQEDHVSMGNASALKCLQVLENVERALAIELLAGAQAVEFLAPLEPGLGVRAAHEFLRSLSSTVIEDRPLADDIEAVAIAISTGDFVAAVEREVGALA